MSWSPARSAEMCACVLFCSVVVWEWGAFWKRTNSDWNSIPELSGETSPNYPEWVDLAWMSCVISTLIPLTKHNSAWRLFYLFLAVTSSRPSSSVPSFYTLDTFLSSVTEVYFERLQTDRKCHALFFSPKNPHPHCRIRSCVCLWNIASHCLFDYDANALIGIAQHGRVVNQFMWIKWLNIEYRQWPKAQHTKFWHRRSYFCRIVFVFKCVCVSSSISCQRFVLSQNFRLLFILLIIGEGMDA